ncbi:uncharacterized protein DDB_G0284459-like, partial [Venturia canescens]|uniref:uncharacterized protein DDB_G0284459-like n=1 Tax=Venturia canescens TaxID=32260 RepID=UPI001C9C5E14
RDELWFIEFGRGAALPLTPEEAPADGEPVVPCAQGRIIVESAREAPPHFAQCSAYKRTGLDEPDQVAVGGMIGGLPNREVNRMIKFPRLVYSRQYSTREQPGSPATRPEELGVRPWYNEQFATTESPSSSIGGGICDRSSYPSSSSSSYPYPQRDPRSLMVGRPNLSLYSVAGSRERESSLDSNDTAAPSHRYAAPRKAYMDLTDAIALLDETCPNQEASPSLTPRTPRTPLTPFPRSKRARSKSSDNSSNYSNEVTAATAAERTLETSKSQEKSSQETKHRRPFLRKIGSSKTEDRPFLAKIAPKVIGKPYLEKIGPSRAIEKPFLEKIGSSKTLDRFTFDVLREFPKVVVKKCQPAEPSPLAIEPSSHPEREQVQELEDDDVDHDDVLCIIEDERADEDDENDDPTDDKTEDQSSLSRSAGSGRRSNGKGYLLKMYSFESDCLNEAGDPAVSMKAHRDPLRGASLDDVLDSGPSSFPPSEDSHEHPSSRSDDRSTSVAELVKCRVTTSEEIFSTMMSHQSSPREAASWGNSPNRWSKRRSRRVASAPRTRADRDQSASLVFPSDDSTPNSPTKRRMSPDRDQMARDRLVISRTKNSSLLRDSTGSPLKTRRQASNEEAGSSDSRRDLDTSKSSQPSSEENVQKEEQISFARCKSRRQTFKEAMEKFSGSENSSGKTRRQVSEDILDKNRKNGELLRFEDPPGRLERRGISSDNLKLSRETVVASVPSTSSLGYQSGDSSLVSQRSSYHSQDFIRGTLKILHDKFELQEVPSESYAAFKRRTRANHQYNQQRDKQRTNGNDSRGNEETTTNNNHKNNNNNNNSSNDNNNGAPNTGMNPPKGSSESRRDAKDASTRSASEDLSTESKSSVTIKSVLRKQEGVDHQSDQETENGTSLRRPKRRMVNEPSQETMDLLTELRRVKSMLKTPSIETDPANDFSKPPTRFPKKILLTDKEFCLSVERENSVRRRPSMIVGEESIGISETSRIERNEQDDSEKKKSSPEKIQTRSSRRERALRGPALFEKRCLSLDYADDEKPPKPEARAISLVAPSRTPRSGTADYDNLDSSDPGGLAYDARSYSSDVFTSPSDENDETRVSETGARNSAESPNNETTTETMNNHCAEVDIAIPVDHVGSISPKRRIHAQGRTSDFYEIISPRSTPFRVKKRLGRISVEEGVKPENFTLNKVDCRSVVNQKRTKCFPL